MIVDKENRYVEKVSGATWPAYVGQCHTHEHRPSPSHIIICKRHQLTDRTRKESLADNVGTARERIAVYATLSIILVGRYLTVTVTNG